jgi:hypothetical protein
MIEIMAASSAAIASLNSSRSPSFILAHHPDQAVAAAARGVPSRFPAAQ